jgi:hypothetical protein
MTKLFSRNALLIAVSTLCAIGAEPSTARKTLDQPARAIPPGPFQPTWESIATSYRAPDWLRDAKFGIFLHWGLYSVPGRGSEWYPRHMYSSRGIIDCVSKNGAYLLHLAPRPDGIIPEDQQLRLLQMGEWLSVHGEAIYGTRPWLKHGEGPTQEAVHARNPERGITNAMLVPYTPQDLRFTRSQPAADSGYTLYAHLFGWPGDNKVAITSLATGASGVIGEITAVSLLGSTQRVQFTGDSSGLHVTLPAWRVSDFTNVLKITGLNPAAKSNREPQPHS